MGRRTRRTSPVLFLSYLLGCCRGRREEQMGEIARGGRGEGCADSRCRMKLDAVGGIVSRRAFKNGR